MNKKEYSNLEVGDRIINKDNRVYTLGTMENGFCFKFVSNGNEGFVIGSCFYSYRGFDVKDSSELNPRDIELLKACKDGSLYDYITNNFNQFNKNELKEIIKQYLFIVYEELGEEKSKTLEQKIPMNLLQYDFFEDMNKADEIYIEYLNGDRTYEDYLEICKELGKNPKEAKL